MHYILNDENDVIPVGFDAWALWLEHNESDRRAVAQTLYGSGEETIKIKTDFLSTNYALDDNSPPVLWETRIFGYDGLGAQYCERYILLADAEAGHRLAVQLLERALPESVVVTKRHEWGPASIRARILVLLAQYRKRNEEHIRILESYRTSRADPSQPSDQ